MRRELGQSARLHQKIENHKETKKGAKMKKLKVFCAVTCLLVGGVFAMNKLFEAKPGQYEKNVPEKTVRVLTSEELHLLLSKIELIASQAKKHDKRDSFNEEGEGTAARKAIFLQEAMAKLAKEYGEFRIK